MSLRIPGRLALLLAGLLLAGAILGMDGEPPFADPALQARYEVLAHELRCPKCQNNTIADSNAPIAADLRRLLREQLEAGKSDAEIEQYMTERYGEFVLYRPPVVPRTWLLWAAPGLLLAGGLAAAVVIIRRKAGVPPDTPDEGLGDDGASG